LDFDQKINLVKFDQLVCKNLQGKFLLVNVYQKFSQILQVIFSRLSRYIS